VIDDLDRTIERLLEIELGSPLGFDLSYAVPNKDFAPVSATRNTLNIYLYDIRENRELRSVAPYLQRQPGGRVERKLPPARVEASYCITAWSPAMPTPAASPSLYEHKLLTDVLRALLRHPELPTAALTGALAGQALPLPTLTILPDVNKAVNDFWSAIGGQLRPSIDFKATLSLDYLDAINGPTVTTHIMRFGPPDRADEQIQIGGRITDSAAPPRPVANAWVRLDATSATVISDSDGRFIFQNVTRGTHQVRVRAVGFTDFVGPIQVPSPFGNYDIALV